MLSSLKKTIPFAALLILAAPPSFAKDGYECAMPYAQTRNQPTEFVCRDNDAIEGRVTIKDIYEKGYQVVATFVAYDVPKIVIEEQD